MEILAVVFHKDPGRFHQFDTMQFHGGWHKGFQFMPYTCYQVLDRTHLSLHEIHIQIKIAMIELFYDVVPYDPAEKLGIHNEARVGIRFALNCHEQFKIMPMPIIVGATSEDLVVLLPAPGWIVELVGSIEMFNPCEEYHGSKEPQN